MSYSRYIPGFISSSFNYVTQFFYKKTQVDESKEEKELSPIKHNNLSNVRARLLYYRSELTALEDEFDNFSQTIRLKTSQIINLKANFNKKPPKTEFLAITTIKTIILNAEKDINPLIEKLQKLCNEANEDNQYLEICNLGSEIAIRLQLVIDQIFEKISKQHNLNETLKEFAETHGFGILIHKDSTDRSDNKIVMKNQLEIKESKDMIRIHIGNLKIINHILSQHIKPLLSIKDEVDFIDETEESTPTPKNQASTNSIVKTLRLTPEKETSDHKEILTTPSNESEAETLPPLSDCSDQQMKLSNNNSNSEGSTQTIKCS